MRRALNTASLTCFVCWVENPKSVRKCVNGTFRCKKHRWWGK